MSKRCFRQAIFTAVLGLLTVTGAVASPVSGQWSGYMTRDGDRLEVQVELSDGPVQHGTFSARDLGAIGIPLQRVNLGEAVHWELVGDETTTVFDGTRKGDTISGTFTENGHNGMFALQRHADSVNDSYVKRDVTFKNGGVQLSGTLFVPRSEGPHRAIIFVHGSGAEGRWASAYLADYLASHGIVSLIYDKRGVGASTGNWRTSTMGDLAGDARAGIDLLSRTPEVDRRYIGVFGHSQGGQLVPAIAANNPLVGFVIDADGPVGPQYLQDIFRVDNFLATKYSGTALADSKRLYREFVDVARSGAAHDRLRADIRAAGDAPWVADLAIPDDASWIWAWYQHYGNYDNRQAWAQVRVPVLILFGGKDALVPVASSIAETSAILKRHGNRRVEVRVFAEADHTLHVPPRTSGGWPHLPAGFPNVIADFVRRLPQ